MQCAHRPVGREQRSPVTTCALAMSRSIRAALTALPARHAGSRLRRLSPLSPPSFSPCGAKISERLDYPHIHEPPSVDNVVWCEECGEQRVAARCGEAWRTVVAARRPLTSHGRSCGMVVPRPCWASNFWNRPQKCCTIVESCRRCRQTERMRENARKRERENERK